VGSWYGATVGTPLFPPTLGAATATDTTLSLAFTAPTAGATPTNYQYALSTDSGTTYGSYTSIGSTSSPISITGLSTNTTYSIRVRSYLTATTQFSDSAETSFNTIPSAPTSLAATATSTTSISISFSQVAGTNTITNYQYAVSSTSASAGFGSWTAFSPVDAASPVVISSLTAGTQYWAKLRAVTAFVTGIESSTANTYTLPEAPTSLVASTSTTTTQVLTFSQTGTVTNYKYAISTDSGASYGAFSALSPTDATSPITITGLTLGTSYYAKLKAVNSSGDSPESSAVSFSTLNNITLNYFVLGGGGGGSSANSWYGYIGSGGGGGGIKTSYGTQNGGGETIGTALSITPGTTLAVAIGGGGGGGAGNTGWSAGNSGTAGGSSTMGTITSTGGSGGYNGGGGAPAGSFGYQNSSGNNYWAIGGSSAAGTAGAAATRNYPSGGYGGDNGVAGNGIATAITGSSVTRGGAGGNGGVQNSNGGDNVYASAGGSGGGGAGGVRSGGAGSAGATNYGAGGGSGQWYQYAYQTSGGSGGSGYVAIRYLNSFGTLTSIGGGLTYSTSVDGSYRVYEFTAGSGNIVFPS
jgi:hypothetical protein